MKIMLVILIVAIMISEGYFFKSNGAAGLYTTITSKGLAAPGRRNDGDM